MDVLKAYERTFANLTNDKKCDSRYIPVYGIDSYFCFLFLFLVFISILVLNVNK